MSKRAEERANQRYALKEITHENVKLHDEYVLAYSQAEKDLTLTWEDIRTICTLSVKVEIDLGREISDQRHYGEVLKRFNETRSHDKQ